ncbi:CHRD domain-containing protein [Lacibacter sediminis]|uniref:CHRD domain-containing protein n=1 Tax=Lacibacter sediminis TaxID=2760713 RepID=A0A7G5XLM2_9BACT|nr:CHRD domain-containing protein [Lacibacter sediminis]QNA46375.1 CHRD domain-containing protein [Lacibacter sediminis]
MRKQFQQTAFLLGITIALASCSKYSNEMTENQSRLSEKQNEFSATMPASQSSDDVIVFTQVVQLEGSQEVPAVDTDTKGIAILRVSKSKKLYSKIIIQKLADGDALRFAHVHMGARGANGPVRIGLADNASQFGINRTIQLTDAQFTLLTEGACYVNAHSNFSPGGIVRGQIR